MSCIFDYRLESYSFLVSHRVMHSCSSVMAGKISPSSSCIPNSMLTLKNTRRLLNASSSSSSRNKSTLLYINHPNPLHLRMSNALIRHHQPGYLYIAQGLSHAFLLDEPLESEEGDRINWRASQRPCLYVEVCTLSKY